MTYAEMRKQETIDRYIAAVFNRDADTATNTLGELVGYLSRRELDDFDSEVDAQHLDSEDMEFLRREVKAPLMRRVLQDEETRWGFYLRLKAKLESISWSEGIHFAYHSVLGVVVRDQEMRDAIWEATSFEPVMFSDLEA
jgi:ribosomal protein S18 acetylase RimI-like enzyme